MMLFKKIILFSFIAVFFSLTTKEKAKTFFRLSKESTLPVFLKSESSWAKKTLQVMTLEEKVAQFFMVATWPNRDENHQVEIENLIKNQKIGGLIYFQGSKEEMKTSIDRMQKASKTPLLIGMDAEWGSAMRVSETARFPYSYTLGTANDVVLTEKIYSMIAQDCREIGVHINFSPVADVNSNPKNPVIGFRSFGEDPKFVSEQVAAAVRGLEKNGILSCIKHFPGHGNTDKDSHTELPTINQSLETIRNKDLLPFKVGLVEGASSVMMAHLSVPSMDDTKTPTSLSKKVIGEYLKKELNFKGLIISDALNMKAVADKYGKIDVVVKAFEAGNDILLFPENVDEAIKAIVAKVKSGAISEKEIDERCLKILAAKDFTKNFKNEQTYSEGEIEWAKRDCYEKSLTLLKNENATLPQVNASSKKAIVSIGGGTSAFHTMLERFYDYDYFHFYTFEEAARRMKFSFSKYDEVVTSIHPKSVTAGSNFSSPGNIEAYLEVLNVNSKNSFVLFGNPNMLKAGNLESTKIGAFLIAYENHAFAQESAAQMIVGAIGVNGKLKFQIPDVTEIGSGINLSDAQRLKFSQIEELGIDPEDMSEIDRIVNKALKAQAFPGCQILVAIDGKIIYQKSFGTVSYEDTTPVNNMHIYDIASVSKIVGSTAALMRLQEQNKFKLDSYLKNYIPDLVGNSEVGNIYLKNMMAHQAGFTPWIAFYKWTVKNGNLDYSIYSKTKRDGFEVPVAKNLWIRNDYEDVIYDKILDTKLARRPKYEYSDLGYYFAKKVIEKQSGLGLDKYLYREFYDPMGLKNIRYLPQLYFPLDRIAPTENDVEFRGSTIHGFVHDPGAAMLGGIGGHAGIFANSQDLAAMMQLFLNKGTYANKEYISPAIIEEYTKDQLRGNRRGAGFDRQTNSRTNGPCCSSASTESYGHSGFTGIFAWADPVYKINYVFLSNRVNPDATNKKIQEMHTRSEIQEAIFDAIKKAKK